MIAVMVAGGVAMLLAATTTPFLINWLSEHRIGQQISEDAPRAHAVKAGTPTMGGTTMVLAILSGYGLAHVGTGVSFTASGLLVMGSVAAAGGVGLADDWIKVRRRRSLGLNKRAKFGGQPAVSVGFVVIALHWTTVSTYLSFTRFDSTGIDLGVVGWALLAMIMIAGTANAVNLTDGLDGLAPGSAALAFASLALIGYWQFRHYLIYHVASSLDLAICAMALAGACVGFLWWNAAPAKIFMGDTGSLAIGTGLAALCLEMNLQLLLPIIGGLFVLVTLSVMIQVVSYRVFHRRVFRMAPLHHHFELAGWPETTVIVRFWILAGLFMVLGLAVFYADFLAVAPQR